jgi:hypothetical protein
MSKLAFIPFIIIFLISNVFAQLIINKEDLQFEPGTIIVTEDDTVDNIIVDVGSPGENKVWNFTYDFPNVQTYQQIVDVESSPFSQDFPEADYAIRYDGKLGNLIHSYYFDEAEGVFYAYQNSKNDSILLQGLGLDSILIGHHELEAYYTGSVTIQPEILLFSTPLEYGKSWESVSYFSLSVENFIPNILLTANITDSMCHTIDGWGTLNLPDTSYECLRMKSYITLIEKLYMDDILIDSTKSHTINYHWLANGHGIVAKMLSHTNISDPDLNDDFKNAKQISRIRRLIPFINFSTIDTTGAPGDTIKFPIYISDMTDLNTTSVQFHMSYDTTILKILDVTSTATISENWSEPNYALSDSGVMINLNGETPLSGAGLLCYVRFQVDPYAQDNDQTKIFFTNINFSAFNPKIIAKTASFEVHTISTSFDEREGENNSPENFTLNQNFPNPFNASTMITYKLAKSGHVTLAIYNVLGKEVNVLLQKNQQIGTYNVGWDGKDNNGCDVPSGIYLYNLKVDNNYNTIKKMLLIR